MAKKRCMNTELNLIDEEADEEREEQGTFQKTSEHILKTRVLKTARRRNPIRSGDSAFAGFTGFANTNKPATSEFAFLNDISKADNVPNTNGIDKQEMKSSSVINPFANALKDGQNIFGSTNSTTCTNIFASSVTTGTSDTIVPSVGTGMKNSENYCSRLKGLNESVSKWIREKVDENPLISLQPIFKDYEKYLEEIEKEESSAPSSENKPVVPTFNFNPSTDKNTKAIADSTTEKPSEKKEIPSFNFGAPSSSTFTFGITNKTDTSTEKTTVEKKEEETPAASSVKPNTSATAASTPVFSFGSSNHMMGSTKSFSSFGSSSSTLTPGSSFSFGSNQSLAGSKAFPTSTVLPFGGPPKSQTDQSTEKNEENNDNDEDEPPKVEFKPVVEKDHIYTVRCKVFVKKDEAYADRGVGNLYLKPIENSEKVQLIVRADTNLGNLLLNFILSESVPTKRMGKKDVMLVAIPTPDALPPPTPLLLRVKSPEEADDLLETLEKHKK